MNIYVKYAPLLYAIRTRYLGKKTEIKEDGSMIQHLTGEFNIDTLYYIYTNYVIWSIPLFIIYFDYNCNLNTLIKALLLYIYISIVFLNFYEIGYLHNDLQGIKKERKRTLHTSEKLDESFYYNSIITRIIIGILLEFPLFIFDYQIFKYFSILLIIVQLIFYIHNKIRKYFYNWITLLLLRFFKMTQVFIPMFFMLGSFDSELYLYMAIIFLINGYFDHIHSYTGRLGFKFEQLFLPYGLLKYGYQTISMIILFILSKNYIFIVYGLLSLVFFIKVTPKHSFKIENDR